LKKGEEGGGIYEREKYGDSGGDARGG